VIHLKKILIVEDDISIHEILETLLEKENYFLKEQQAEQDEIILETNYALLLMQESITDIV